MKILPLGSEPFDAVRRKMIGPVVEFEFDIAIPSSAGFGG